MFHWNSRACASWMHRIVKKTKVASEPEALGNSFGVPGITVKQIGVEAGPLLQWLHAGLKRAGFDAILLETRNPRSAAAVACPLVARAVDRDASNRVSQQQVPR